MNLVGGVGNVVGTGQFVTRAESPAYGYYGDACVAGGLDIGPRITNHYGVGAVCSGLFHYVFHKGGIGL